MLIPIQLSINKYILVAKYVVLPEKEDIQRKKKKRELICYVPLFPSHFENLSLKKNIQLIICRSLLMYVLIVLIKKIVFISVRI